MSAQYEERKSSSPFIKRVWRAYPEEAGGYMDMPTEEWSIMVSIKNGIATTFLVGPTAIPKPITYEAGIEYFGIVFKPHTFLPDVSKESLINQTKTVANHSAIPSYEKAELFVDQLVSQGVLLVDTVVAEVLAGETPYLSSRAVQLHFVKTTGLTLNYIRQIERARQAESLLQKGVPILDVVYEAGYADQPHMTKSLKRLIGKTPAQILRLAQEK